MMDDNIDQLKYNIKMCENNIKIFYTQLNNQ